jgi:hypothetical protein
MDGVLSEAIMFFDDGNIVKEMLYPEFEAMLDHVVGVDDFKGREVPSVYVRIDNKLNITAAVFFLISFNEQGYTDRTWNLPLQHLAESSGRGPDLGSGAIQLACRSQCSVSWHYRSLWDPVINDEESSLALLASRIRKNRLGLVFEKEPTVNATRSNNGSKQKNESAVDKKIDEDKLKQQLEKKYQQQLEKRLSDLKQEYKLRVESMKSEAQEHIAKMRRHNDQQVNDLNLTLQSTKQLFTEEKHKNLQLKNQLALQAHESEKIRERFKNDLVKGQEVEQEKLLALEEHYQQELNAKVDSATTELKEMLDMRDVEIFYRDEQIGRLNEDVVHLREEKQKLLDNSGNKVLQRLVDDGISFVAAQPGVEQVVVPVADISSYLENSLAYVAEKNAMNPQLYAEWIEHYHLPACNEVLSDGGKCGEPVRKIDKPSRFISGESNRCSKHNRSANLLSNLIKMR